MHVQRDVDEINQEDYHTQKLPSCYRKTLKLSSSELKANFKIDHQKWSNIIRNQMKQLQCTRNHPTHKLHPEPSPDRCAGRGRPGRPGSPMASPPGMVGGSQLLNASGGWFHDCSNFDPKNSGFVAVNLRISLAPSANPFKQSAVVWTSEEIPVDTAPMCIAEALSKSLDWTEKIMFCRTTWSWHLGRT